MSVVQIARCPEHGLHGERTECFACGGPVEQVPMVEAALLDEAIEALRELIRTGDVGSVCSRSQAAEYTKALRDGRLVLARLCPETKEEG